MKNLKRDLDKLTAQYETVIMDREDLSETGRRIRKDLMDRLDKEIANKEGLIREVGLEISKIEAENSRWGGLEKSATEMRALVERSKDLIRKLTWEDKRDLIEKSNVMIEVDWKAVKPKAMLVVDFDITQAANWLKEKMR